MGNHHKSAKRSVWLLGVLLLAFQAACGGASPTAATALPPTTAPLATASSTPVIALLTQPVLVEAFTASPTNDLASPTQPPQTLPPVESTATQPALASTPSLETPAASLTPTATPVEICQPASGFAWAYTYGESAFNLVESIFLPEDGDVIFIGSGGGFVPGYYTIWAIRMNPDGRVAWQKAYQNAPGNPTGVASQVLPGQIVISDTNRAFAISEQDGSIIWQRAARQPLNAIDMPDGGFALVGENWATKFDTSGKQVWQFSLANSYWSFPSPKSEFYFARLFLYAETTSVYMPIYTDIEVLKFNAEGKLAWQRTYGRTFGDDEELSAMLPTQDGGLLLAGMHNGPGEFLERDIWVLKLSAGGSISWQTTLSGKWFDQVYHLAQTPTGEYLLAGTTETILGEPEALVVKLRSNGAVAWQKTLSQYGRVDALIGLKDGGTLVSLADDPMLVRLDRSGNLVWDKTYRWGIYLDHLAAFGDGLLASGRGYGQALMALLDDDGAPSGAIEVKNSNLGVSSTLGGRPNQKLEFSQTQFELMAPKIVVVEVDLPPAPWRLAQGGLQVVPTRTPTATPVVTPSPTPPPYTRSLYLTTPPMNGEDVLAVQVRLRDLGYSEVGEPDGIFGAMTDLAVRNFQRRNRLEADGVVGPQTWQRLFSPQAVRK